MKLLQIGGKFLHHQITKKHRQSKPTTNSQVYEQRHIHFKTYRTNN
jgi:hypothetical protein